MIIDIPTPDDFKVCGLDYLNIAWEMTIEVSLYAVDEDSDTFIEGTANEYWDKAQRKLATAISLVQQGTEFLLKGKIAETSPFLLFSKEPNTWPKKIETRDVRFSEFKTIDAQDLIKIYNTTTSEKDRLKEDFKDLYENLRSTRNTFMHSIDSKSLFKDEWIFIQILEICHYLIGPKSWIENRRNYIYNKDITSVVVPEESLLGSLVYEIVQVINRLKRSDTEKYFGFNKNQRRYICPGCNDEYYENPKIAQLQPNQPNSTSVFCIVCNNNYQVTRKDCIDPNCPGNVIYFEPDNNEEVCLTCGRIQN